MSESEGQCDGRSLGLRDIERLPEPLDVERFPEPDATLSFLSFASFEGTMDDRREVLPSVGSSSVEYR